MSYVDELRSRYDLTKHGFTKPLGEACAEVDRLRTDLAAARAEAGKGAR